MVIERLQHSEVLYKIATIHKYDQYSGSDGKKFSHNYGGSFAKSLETLTEFYNNTPELNETCTWDLTFNNVMLRGDTPIIVDPFVPKSSYDVVENHYENMIDTSLLHSNNDMHNF